VEVRANVAAAEILNIESNELKDASTKLWTFINGTSSATNATFGWGNPFGKLRSPKQNVAALNAIARLAEQVVPVSPTDKVVSENSDDQYFKKAA
jgi:hypothetical protein